MKQGPSNFTYVFKFKTRCICLGEIVKQYEQKSRLPVIGEKFVKSGTYAASGREAATYFKQAAEALGINIAKYDLEKTRKSLGKGTPMSSIIRELRDKSGPNMS